MPYKAQVIADSSGTWAGNALVFPTEGEAQQYVKDLESRWLAVTATRVVETDDEPNYKWVNGGPERIAV